MFCGECGAENSGGAFCTNCGRPVTSQLNDFPPKMADLEPPSTFPGAKIKKPRFFRSWIIYVSSILLLLGLAGEGVTYYFYQQEVSAVAKAKLEVAADERKSEIAASDYLNADLKVIKRRYCGSLGVSSYYCELVFGNKYELQAALDRATFNQTVAEATLSLSKGNLKTHQVKVSNLMNLMLFGSIGFGSTIAMLIILRVMLHVRARKRWSNSKSDLPYGI